MPLLKFTIAPESLTAFGIRFTSDKKRQVRIALYNIRREWVVALARQQEAFQGGWAPWSTYGGHELSSRSNSKGRKIGGKVTQRWRSYAQRREAEKRRPPAGVKYFTILKRTGRMMDRYLKGIRVDESRYAVIIPWPSSGTSDKSVTIRAKVHQGVLEQPKGSKGPRPFNIAEFDQLARTIINAAIKSDPKKGSYKGYSG